MYIDLILLYWRQNNFKCLIYEVKTSPYFKYNFIKFRGNSLMSSNMKRETAIHSEEKHLKHLFSVLSLD